jgi:uncharacterized protein YbaP (TraB family)
MRRTIPSLPAFRQEHPLVRLRSLLLGLALLIGYAAGASAQAASCAGKNMLDEIKGSDAAAHAKVMAAAAATENATALLWKVERAGKAPSYLFGTMHLTDDRVTALAAAAKAALANARRLVLEVDDLSPGSFAKALVNARDLMMFTDGRRLEQLLGDTEFRKVAGILERSGMPAQLAGTFRPWVATLMLALSDCEKQRVAQGQLPLDLRLAREAEGLGIGVAGLETLEGQFRAMADVPEADQVEMLKASLRLYDRVDDVVETTVQLYATRQLGAIWPLQLVLAEKVGVAAKVFDAAEQSLLTVRNLRMRDKALAHLDQGGAMIAVGALHLPGRQGLVALFREAGYTVTAVE